MQRDDGMPARDAGLRRRRVNRIVGRPRLDELPSLPAGHPSSWDLINAGTVLAGEPYPADVPRFLGRGG